jgi:hypothetical protein
LIDPAAIRPDDWNLALFLHLLGAFALVGALVTAATHLFAARRDGSIALARMGYRALLLVALPAFIVNRVAAQWIASEEGVDSADLAWINIGYMSTDIGVLALIAATVAAGVTVRRAGRAEGPAPPGSGISFAAWAVAFLIVVYAVVIWVMATKPA